MFLREASLQAQVSLPATEFQAIILGGSSRYWAEVFDDDVVNIDRPTTATAPDANDTDSDTGPTALLGASLHQSTSSIDNTSDNDDDNNNNNNSTPVSRKLSTASSSGRGPTSNDLKTMSSTASSSASLNVPQSAGSTKRQQQQHQTPIFQRSASTADAETDWDLSNCCTMYKGKPILHHQLLWLESARIQDVTILCPQSVRGEVVQCVEKYETSADIRLKIQVVGTKEEEDESALALLSIKDRIKHDFIVLSGIKFVDTPPQQMLDFFRARAPTMTSMFYNVPDKKTVGKEVWRREEEFAQFTGIDTSKSRLLISSPMDTADDQDLRIRISLLKKFPKVNVYSTLRDARVYIFKQFVIDILAARRDLISVRRDLIKILIQCQYRPGLITRSGIFNVLKSKRKYLSAAQNLSSSSTTVFKEELDQIVQEDFYRREHFNGSSEDPAANNSSTNRSVSRHKKNISTSGGSVRSSSSLRTSSISPQRRPITSSAITEEISSTSTSPIASNAATPTAATGSDPQSDVNGTPIIVSPSTNANQENININNNNNNIGKQQLDTLPLQTNQLSGNFAHFAGSNPDLFADQYLAFNGSSNIVAQRATAGHYGASIQTPISGMSLGASDISICNTVVSGSASETEIYCAAILGQSIYTK